MSEPAVLYEAKDYVATITLNRPENRNSMTDDVLEGLRSVRRAREGGSGAALRDRDRPRQELLRRRRLQVRRAARRRRRAQAPAERALVRDVQPVPVDARDRGAGDRRAATVTRSAAASGSRWCATSASRTATRSTARTSPSSASTRAWRPPTSCRAWSVCRAPRSCCSPGASSPGAKPRSSAWSTTPSPRTRCCRARSRSRARSRAARRSRCAGPRSSLYRNYGWDPVSAAEGEAHAQSRTFETEDSKEGVAALLEKRAPVFKDR